MDRRVGGFASSAAGSVPQLSGDARVVASDRVAYREAGAGEALLLIHGMAGSSATWRAVLPQLSKKYRVVAPDLFGHGESAFRVDLKTPRPVSDYASHQISVKAARNAAAWP